MSDGRAFYPREIRTRIDRCEVKYPVYTTPFEVTTFLGDAEKSVSTWVVSGAEFVHKNGSFVDV
jgi:hypothetical protein